MLTNSATNSFSLGYSGISEVRSGALWGGEGAESLAPSKMEHMDLFRGGNMWASVQASTHARGNLFKVRLQPKICFILGVKHLGTNDFQNCFSLEIKQTNKTPKTGSCKPSTPAHPRNKQLFYMTFPCRTSQNVLHGPQTKRLTKERAGLPTCFHADWLGRVEPVSVPFFLCKEGDTLHYPDNISAHPL